jgi:hypothetical protein
MKNVCGNFSREEPYFHDSNYGFIKSQTLDKGLGSKYICLTPKMLKNFKVLFCRRQQNVFRYNNIQLRSRPNKDFQHTSGCQEL